ncbi:hypothetical protein TSOC_013485 [Tetrabaena socialis]|uniref:Polysaccharide pyruvyl transferase domain-containing protein n=1 Tax=Tetrabaena socialis TaxID=47790 RepID=A0A2J7ZK93_9CHLO|nr:hypothetical protein TSOC_013485 [Tetrabaena socialis]|eukprot:PNH00681.1 hypothetical protein TSOC_013485 [Tetrabaena socialis]
MIIRVLVLGFYDRDNAGDELYKLVLPNILAHGLGPISELTELNSESLTLSEFEFKSMDDASAQSLLDVDVLICGGGDIINSYFMSKLQSLLSDFTGRVYALSVGIPYPADAHYLHMFDHVFVRSRLDFSIASKEIGTRNVTYLPDAAMSLVLGKSLENRRTRTRTSIGICLAQPAFFENPHSAEILDAMVTAICSLATDLPLEVHLISMNQTPSNESESDLVVNSVLQDKLVARAVRTIFPRHLRRPIEIYDYLARNVDVMISMRYHSVIFAVSLHKPVVVLYCSPKVDKVIQDFRMQIDEAYQLPTAPDGKPTSCDATVLFNCMSDAFREPRARVPLPPFDFTGAHRLIFIEKKTQCPLVKSACPDHNFDNVLQTCAHALARYLRIDGPSATSLLSARGPFLGGDKSPNAYEGTARLICYCITRDLASPYIWGLAANMAGADFCLQAAIRYIWEDTHDIAVQEIHEAETYYPYLAVKRRAFLTIDSIFSNDFRGYHRSGWGYVVGGMRSLDAQRMHRRSPIMLDTYMDRTFHWGNDALAALDLIPYRTPWIGILHHTFDTTHSTYNCTELFANSNFIASLAACRGIIVLTETLASDLRKRLLLISSTVPVHVIYHPTETVEAEFTLFNFIQNRNRKVIQVGAWLRNPYAIYELPLAAHNKLTLRKAALKGKDMDQYFRPPWMLDRLRAALVDGPSTPLTMDALCRPDTSPDTISRPEICRPNQLNKYCAGLYDAILRNDQSVTVLERVSNADYDKLLSSNIVFLNLVDCSAVNTVLECIVRNTPLLVNRHPAIEEVLGSDYPGFYSDLHDAARFLESFHRIRAAHVHLKKLDKRPFSLDVFMDQLQDILVEL